ncbi:biotin/lipoyl-containing protein, partial [uncultured Alsobacter sp.]|uniref:biotin/lipoyl-containing protein n=1 Tax=uncultured Alsobacter sp. TaxID=1748258 RepID=UPI0025E4AACD
MAEITVKLPDVGEGVAEAELVEWRVKAGDVVREDDILAAVMTDKATVEIPAPHSGRVVFTNGEVGQTLAVGSVLVRLEAGEGAVAAKPAPPPVAEPAPEPAEDAPADAGPREPAPAPVKAAPAAARPE